MMCVGGVGVDIGGCVVDFWKVFVIDLVYIKGVFFYDIFGLIEFLCVIRVGSGVKVVIDVVFFVD